VFVQAKNSILEKADERFNLGLKNVKAVRDIKRGDGYDLCFWVSDGSVPALLARKNILHLQRPFYDVDGKSLINRMKFFRIHKIVVNSLFTKSWIDKEYPKESVVIYPPVDVKNFKPKRKENLILSTGRFSQLEQSKRQDVLVDGFKKLYDLGYKDYQLVLAGASDIGRTDFVDKLKTKSENYPIEVLENLAFKEIKELYAKAKIFWTASGFGVSKDKPEKMEHFGIALVEAMASGAVVLAYNAGGHREIIKDHVNGFLWNNVDELVSETRSVLDDKGVLGAMTKKSLEDSGKYSYERFKKEFLAVI
jgi:glycosyltransferase involved in cell wall biosynthesis